MGGGAAPVPSSAARDTRSRTAHVRVPPLYAPLRVGLQSFFAAARREAAEALRSGLTPISRPDGRVQELFQGVEQALSKDIEVADGIWLR